MPGLGFALQAQGPLSISDMGQLWGLRKSLGGLGFRV